MRIEVLAVSIHEMNWLLKGKETSVNYRVRVVEMFRLGKLTEILVLTKA